MTALVYLFHGIFWSAFLVRVFRPRGPVDQRKPPAKDEPDRSARHPGLLVFVHGIGFAAMYNQMWVAAFFPGPPTMLFPSLWPLGAAVILLGAALFAWALWVFGSWRILAKLESRHRLCTAGPYRLLRHPIYFACDLLAIGTFLWIPTLGMLIALALMLLGAHLRARGEEKLLLRVFGDEYRAYCRKTKRYVPGVI